MSELLHQNSIGISIIRTDLKRRSHVKVISHHNGSDYTHRTYRFNNIPDRYFSIYMSWANLDCCGGWSFDEEYLRHAVQNEKKLYADISISLKDRYFPDAPTTPEAIASLYQLQDTLPDTLCAGIDNRISNNKHLNIYICRRGAIKDFFSLNIVFLFYQKLGIHLSDQTKDEVSRYCVIEISDFSSSAAPYVYYDSSSPAELITTGLLLGYPIESTASLLEGF